MGSRRDVWVVLGVLEVRRRLWMMREVVLVGMLRMLGVLGVELVHLGEVAGLAVRREVQLHMPRLLLILGVAELGLGRSRCGVRDWRGRGVG